MPISSDEFESGSVEADGSADETASPIEAEKELIVSFLSERQDRAFTEREIVLGVDFSPVYESETDRGGGLIAGVGELADGLVDVAGNVAASAIVVDDVDEALAALVEEGAVETKEVDAGDGSTVYYRLAE